MKDKRLRKFLGVIEPWRGGMMRTEASDGTFVRSEELKRIQEQLDICVKNVNLLFEYFKLEVSHTPPSKPIIVKKRKSSKKAKPLIYIVPNYLP